MLQLLRIKNYALIDDAEINFAEGFTTITGETGAGKSIMLGALGLLLGKRADTSVLKDSSVKSVVEAQFSVGAYKLEKLFEENDVDYEAETLIRREITPAGKSRAFVNDTPVNLNFLKDLGSYLIEVHSQQSNAAMHDPDFHLEVIDLLAKNTSLLTECKKVYSNYKSHLREYEKLKASAENMRQEAEYKQFLYDELVAGNFKEGEQEELEQDFALQSNLEEVKTAMLFTLSVIDDEETGSLQNINQAVKAMQSAGKYNADVEVLANRLKSVSIELSDLSDELNSLETKFEHDPDRVELLRSRIDLLHQLLHKHKVADLSELLVEQARLEADLAVTNNLDEHLAALYQQVEAAESELQVIADKLRTKREEIIPLIEKKIVTLLRNLGIANANVNLVLEPTENYTDKGCDKISFLFAANKNAALQPVQDTASGGEISRIMLCLKSIISSSKQLPTIVFDEIDVGVSGDIAEKMGIIMKAMSKDMQVLSITHLPQIASKGQHHFAVHKKDTEHSTSTYFTPLSEEKRIEEIAKMLSGKELTEAALKNASHLLRS